MKTNEMVKRLRRVGVLLWSNEGGVTRPILSGSSVADQIEHQQEEIERLYRLIDGLYDALRAAQEPDFAAMTDGQLKALAGGPAGGSNAVAT